MAHTRHLLTRMASGLLLSAAAGAASASPCTGTPAAQEADLAGIQAHLQADVRTRGRQVLSFLGFSGAGYQDKAAMLALAGRVLAAEDPARVVVNIGATADGIGAVYALARQRGFHTLGIVSTQARDGQVPLSPCVDQVFYVRDSSWGGLDSATGALSPTSQAMVALSSRLVAIGGGDIARDELLAARRLGKPVQVHAADMDHALARAKAKRRGEPAPVDFRGTAHPALAPG
jgi:hypothetical protein